MRTRHLGNANPHRTGAIRVFSTSVSGVAILLAGLGFLLAPAAPVAAAPPPQGWTTTEAPLPADAGNGTTDPQVYTASTTCPAANACVVVGWYQDDNSPQTYWGLIEQQNGTSWTDTEAPEPPNHGTGSAQGLWLGSNDCGYNLPCRAVSCPTTSFCIAVGNYTDTGGYEEPVVETFSNGSWAATEAPLPNDTAMDSGPTVFPDSNLYAVSCTSTSSCVAVGTYLNTSGHYVGLIETLSGTTWTATPAPEPAGAAPANSEFPPRLVGVSCASATSCVAVGSSFDGSNFDHGVIETLTGSTWTATTPPVPNNAGNTGDGHQNTLLAQVACPSATMCQAVGFYLDTTGNQFGLINTWNGSTWSATEAPQPSGGSFASLGAVSCPTPSFCAADGAYDDSSAKTWGLIDTYANGTWTGAQAQLPSNSLPTSSSNFYSALTEVSCPTPGFCITIGTYRIPTNANTAFTDTLSAGSWTTLQSSLPMNATPDGGIYSTGRTVGCDSPVACVIGGNFNDAANHSQGFLDTWTGPQGYWLDASDGGIFTYPNNTFYGSTGGLKLNKPMVGMAATPDPGQGYWLVASDGGIFSYGDALFHGSRGGQPLNKPIVGMAATADGNGYWLVASDGGIFNYGDAGFYGSRGGQPINAPIVGMAATADGKGYWLVGADGGIYSYGDAQFQGSTGALKLNKPVVGMATPTGLGYWLVASDGGIFNYGDAQFYGSTGSLVLNKPVVGMAGSPSGKGYWLVASDGGIFNYGDAPFQGSAGALPLNAPVVGMAGG